MERMRRWRGRGRPWHGSREPSWNEPCETASPAWKRSLVDAELPGLNLRGFLDLISGTLGILRASSVSLGEVSDQGSHVRHNAVGPSCFFSGSTGKGSATGPSAKAIDGSSLTSKRTPGASTKAGASPWLCPETSRRSQNTKRGETHWRAQRTTSTGTPKEAHKENQSVWWDDEHCLVCPG